MQSDLKKLAIVIPAYKSKFFAQALSSIASQTCKDFTLYIGDDASPQDLLSIIQPLSNQISIVYKRFDENLGGFDLVGHWNRCLSMTRGEEWIWLFSDDDLMDSNCVEVFYDNVSNTNCDLFHFDLEVIDENNNKLFKTKRFSTYFSATQYFESVIKHEVYSCVVEFIFRKSQFQKMNGFVNFDLAWSSDTATWIKLSSDNGIKTLPGAIVKWRMSTLNISSSQGNQMIVERKVSAMVSFLQWVRDYFVDRELSDSVSTLDKVKWILTALVDCRTMSLRRKWKLIEAFMGELNYSGISSVRSLFLFMEVKTLVKLFIGYKG